MKKFWQLFLTFFKLGAFTFGGGYAMISLIENEVVTKRGWLTRDDMMDIITIAESTPGPIAINMATFVGTKVKGFWGAVIATIGLVIPPFAIICVISLVLEQFKAITLVAYALKGIQAGVVVLIFNAFLKFFKNMDKNIISFIFLAVAFFVSLFTDFSVVLLILIGGVVGVSITFISSAIAKKKLAKVEANNASDGVVDDSEQNTDATLSNDVGDTQDVSVDSTLGDEDMQEDERIANLQKDIKESEIYDDIESNGESLDVGDREEHQDKDDNIDDIDESEDKSKRGER